MRYVIILSLLVAVTIAQFVLPQTTIKSKLSVFAPLRGVIVTEALHHVKKMKNAVFRFVLCMTCIIFASWKEKNHKTKTL